MELRFLEGNFEHGKFKLQYREFDMHNQITDWKDVPCVKANPKWCEHIHFDNFEWHFRDWSLNLTEQMIFCPICGAVKP
jgi:hypothetical protein